jgi:hypothetical protein
MRINIAGHLVKVLNILYLFLIVSGIKEFTLAN